MRRHDFDLTRATVLVILLVLGMAMQTGGPMQDHAADLCTRLCGAAAG